MEDFLTIDDMQQIYMETGLTLEELSNILNSPRVFDTDLSF